VQKHSSVLKSHSPATAGSLRLKSWKSKATMRIVACKV